MMSSQMLDRNLTVELRPWRSDRFVICPDVAGAGNQIGFLGMSMWKEQCYCKTISKSLEPQLQTLVAQGFLIPAAAMQ